MSERRSNPAFTLQFGILPVNLQPVFRRTAPRIGVLHLVDMLDAGGMERVAVNLVNALPRERYEAHLCTTRRDGPLAGLIAADVGRLRLQRRRTLEWRAVRQLADYIEQRHIRLLHAHGSALFMARAGAALARGRTTVLWHDHYGRYLEVERPAWLYRLMTHHIGGIITVNEPLAEWARRRLRVPAERIWYVPNFVCQAEEADAAPMLPGKSGARIVCVANLRPQKDHLTLIRALELVKRVHPQAHLILVGSSFDRVQLACVLEEIAQQGLTGDVTYLGERRDVSAILRACDIGVLSSASEGMPLALIEYGMARLPVVATAVGQCAEILDQGRAGCLVPAAAPKALAQALLHLLQHPAQAAALGARFYNHVQAHYSAEVVTQRIGRIYESVLASDRAAYWLAKRQVDLAG
jgi:glycosyltransferase involved in cell wall biosynthesis